QPILSAAGYQERIPVTLQGRASFNGTATGKLSDIAFAGTLQSQNFEVLIRSSQGTEKRVRWDSLVADVQLSPHLFAAHNAVLRRGRAEIGFDVSAGLRERQLTETSPITARIDVRQVEAAEVLALAGYDYPLTGVMNLHIRATGSGTLEEPVINAELSLHSLTLDRELAGDLTINAVTQGPEMRVTARAQFQNAELQINGNVHLRDDWPASLSLHFNHLDVDSLVRTYLRGRVTGHSALAGDVQLEGPLKRPRELRITANHTDLFADVQDVKVRNDGPLRFSVSSQLLKIDQFH